MLNDPAETRTLSIAVINHPYVNAGNPLVLEMVPFGVRRILDVGCGGGDNARHLRARIPDVEVVGLTHNAEEASIAAAYLDEVYLIDLQRGLTTQATAEWGDPFDLILFSHVLEHLIDPVEVIRRCLMRLNTGGYVLIAVPNVLEWRTRMEFFCGSFSYSDHGILDRTHLRFYNYNTAPVELISPIHGLELIDFRGRGSVPLGPLRRIKAARRICEALDRIGVLRWPNLFASETVMLAHWQGHGHHEQARPGSGDRR